MNEDIFERAKEKAIEDGKKIYDITRLVVQADGLWGDYWLNKEKYRYNNGKLCITYFYQYWNKGKPELEKITILERGNFLLPKRMMYIKKEGEKTVEYWFGNWENKKDILAPAKI